MTDRIFLKLSDGWALGYDQRQWMVMRRYKRLEEWYWNPVAFIATDKRILRRVLREKGAVITPDAENALNHLPDTFREWLTTLDLQEAAE